MKLNCYVDMSRIPCVSRVMRLSTSPKNLKNCETEESRVKSSCETLRSPCEPQCPPPCPCPPEVPLCPKPPPPGPFCADDEELGAKEKLWKLATFGSIPVVLFTIAVTMMNLKNDVQPRPEYKPYEYMYIRAKPFPWGDGNHGLFHNPERNAVPPHGYEVPDPHAEQ